MSKKINSRAKGQSFERKVAAMLNQKFDTNEFSRSPGSGAFATTHNLPDHLQIYGDLITPQDFRFCIEAKCGYDIIDLPGLLRETNQLYDWIKQAKRDAKKAGRRPLIIVQHTRREAYCLIDSSIEIECFLHKNTTTPPIMIAGLELIPLKTLLQVPNDCFVR